MKLFMYGVVRGVVFAIGFWAAVCVLTAITINFHLLLLGVWDDVIRSDWIFHWSVAMYSFIVMLSACFVISAYTCFLVFSFIADILTGRWREKYLKVANA